MKTLLIGLVASLCLWAVPIEAAITFGAATSNGSASATSIACTLTGVTSGDLIVVATSNNNGGNPVISLADDQGSAYTLDESYSDVGLLGRVYSAVAGATATHIITFTQTNAFRIGCIATRFSGSFNAARLNAHTKTSDAGPGTAVSSGNITTTCNDALLFGATVGGSAETATLGTGYSNFTAATNGRLGAESKIVAGTVTDDADFTLGMSDTWGAVVAAYRESGATCAGPPIGSLQLLGVGR